jgi:OOP family OmpA-OmpF porin
MKSTLKILFAASALLITSGSFADATTSATPINKGFYIGGNAGYGSTTCSTCSLSLFDSGSTSNSGFAGDIFAGYQLNSYVAFEAGWGILPSVSFGDSDFFDLGDDTATASHFYAAVKGMLPLNNQWGLFGKVGFDSMSISSDDLDSTSASGVLLAAGGSYNFTSKFAATLSYNQLIDSTSGTSFTVGYGALGLTYLF